MNPEAEDVGPDTSVPGELPSTDPADEAPVDGVINVTVSVPETLDIKMVNASALTDFEIWFFISSLLTNAVVGFLVAYLQSGKDSVKDPSGVEVVPAQALDAALLAVTLMFLALLVIAIGMTLYKRKQLRTRSKTVTIGTFGTT